MRAHFSFVLLAACAQNGSGALGQADSQYAGKALAAGIEDSASGYGAVNTAAFDASCVTASGDAADPDGDSIPNAATLTFDCTNTAVGYTTTLSGMIDVSDTQPSQQAWAFTANAKLHAALTGAEESATTDRMGSITATQASPTGPFALARALDVTTKFSGRTNVTVDETANWTMTYTPQAAWTPGGLAVAGSLAVTGTWNVSVGGRSADAMLATPTPLTLTPSCASRVTAGTVAGTYTAGGHTSTISVTWTGCGVSTVTYSQQ